MIKIAIFASGSGSNAQKIMEHFQNSAKAQVALILSNKKDAYVLTRADNFGVPTAVFDKTNFYENRQVLDLLQNNKIDFIVLAGFLWLMPTNIIQAFPKRIINIHPALLPKYGGKGMYGMKVHEAVWQNKETESGITIHYVNEKYDEGQIIFQAHCQIVAEDNPDSIAQKVHELEYMYFSEVIDNLVSELEKTKNS
jgi:phosphoribosylglycinamide formyltransferase-1